MTVEKRDPKKKASEDGVISPKKNALKKKAIGCRGAKEVPCGKAKKKRRRVEKKRELLGRYNAGHSTPVRGKGGIK